MWKWKEIRTYPAPDDKQILLFLFFFQDTKIKTNRLHIVHTIWHFCPDNESKYPKRQENHKNKSKIKKQFYENIHADFD